MSDRELVERTIEGELIERVVLPYSPRWFQKETHELLALYRFAVLVFHRRAGKTVLAIIELIKRIIMCKLKNPRGYYIAPYYGQVKRIAWQYLQDFTVDIPGMTYNKSELSAIFPTGAEIQLLGGDNYNALRGIYADYVVLDEYAQMHPSLWGEVFRPALSDRKGGALFIGTPFGENQFKGKWDDAGQLEGWCRAMYKVHQTGAISADEIIAITREITREEFEQEYLCSWTAAVKGSYYGKQMELMDLEGRITSVPHDPALQVITSWDLGMKHLTVVHYWQIAGGEYRMIDVETFTGVGLPEMIKVCADKPYNYLMHIAPADIRVREIGTGKSRLDTAASLGINFEIAPDLSIKDGIDQVKMLLPRMVIDRKLCADSISAHRLYRSEYDEKRKKFGNAPLQDWTCDYCDSSRYFAITPKQPIRFALTPLDYTERDRSVI